MYVAVMTPQATRSPFATTDILVGLDTCILRNLAYDEPAWLAPFEAMSKAGIKFSFLDNVSAEITQALQEERLTFESLKLAIARAETFLFKAAPILPGGKDLRWIIGATDVGPGKLEPFTHASAIWINMRNSRSLRDLETPFITGDESQAFEMSIAEQPQVAGIFDEARTRWIENIKAFDEADPGTMEAISGPLLAEMRLDIDNGRVVPSPPLSTRLDLLLRYRVRLAEMRNQTEAKRLNPESQKRRNDAIDMTMLSALMLPAILCLESKFARSLRLLSGFQTAWVHDADSLVAAWQGGTLLRPEWPI